MNDLEERRRLMEAVERAAQQRKDADLQYEEAVMKAHQAGISNNSLAHFIGVSETCIRQYIKRRKETA